MATIEERVRAGATLLDSTVPGWAEQVRVDLLDMFDCFGCVLGQVFAEAIDSDNGIKTGYDAGCKILGISSAEGCWSESASLGFHAAIKISQAHFFTLSAAAQDVVRAAVHAEYAALRTAWLAEIEARLRPANNPFAARDEWLRRINAHMPADQQLDESDVAEVAEEASPL